MLCVDFRGCGSLQTRHGLAVRRRRCPKRCVYPVRRGYAVASGQHDRHRTHCQEEQEPFDVRHRLLSPNGGMFDSKPILLGEGSETTRLSQVRREGLSSAYSIFRLAPPLQPTQFYTCRGGQRNRWSFVFRLTRRRQIVCRSGSPYPGRPRAQGLIIIDTETCPYRRLRPGRLQAGPRSGASTMSNSAAL